MATGAVHSSARVLVMAVFTSIVSLWVCSAASSHFHGNALKGLLRIKRDTCVDGTYVINGRTCCRCAAGQFRLNHCSSKPGDTECSVCEKGTYNSEPNSETSCQPCTSCDQPHAGLEVDEPCTSARNTKCKCTKGHYCESGDCRVCQPCQECGSEGVKNPCTATQNTVCGDRGNNPGTIAGAVVGVLLAAVVGAAGFLYWKNRRNNQSVSDSNPAEEDLPLIDLYPHLPDIADTIGWREMQRLSMRSSIKRSDIDACQLNHPNDSQSQTLDLLKIWVEKHGKESSRKLIQLLNEHDMRDKAEAVKSILRKESTAA